ncbi:T9SS outer membrane translocon Sov/SprA [Adhaeribacter terrigena]|uniref:T9SS outer membrane translocon Sov/SprA n=1 Tax=Adhaeribacter terrigena TaxID=2793070 RepID=UPI001F363DE7|nr:cell surface protein SprA [Adhaeribacter terrigena]
MISNKGRTQTIVASVVVISLLAWLSQAATTGARGNLTLTSFRNLFPPDTTLQDTTRNRPYQPSKQPTYRPKDRTGDPFSNKGSNSPLLLGDPANVKTNVTLDDSLRYYEINEEIGGFDYRNPSYMTFEEYSKFQQQQAIRNYWRTKSAGQDGESVVASKRVIPKIYISSAFDRIFGGNYVDIRPNGNVTLRFGARFNRNFNRQLPLRQQRVGDFEFDQNITLNLIGQIGEKLKLSFNWDTKANFEFENNMKLEYTGYDEEIIRKIEAGNVSLPLNNSLISGGQNLFGVKTQLQFGRLGVTTIASNIRGQVDEVNIQNGAQNRIFEIKASDYEKDRHFFLAQFFRDRYDAALKDLPLVNSGITIRRLEVYITNDNRATENLRNMVALMDLAEGNRNAVYNTSLSFPGGSTPRKPADNKANSLFDQVTKSGTRDNNQVDAVLAGQGLVKAIEFEHVKARKLNQAEYKFNPQLGYISLNSALLPEQVLGVAFEYTLNGKTYKVGELQDDYQNITDDQVIFLKMLKSTNPALGLPTWDLMMKNIYSLNASQVSRDNFQLNIIYKDDETGVDINSLREGNQVKDRPLVSVFNLDNVNRNNDKPSDGNFDFLTDITIDPENGRIIFPEVEPFGSYLRSKFEPGTEDALIQKYVYQELYDSTQTDAQQFANKNKFFLQGRYQATATDEIILPGIQIAEGSVTVFSGGTQLQENVDYQVNYQLGRVKILNPSYLNSASNLKVNFEKAQIVNVQPRTLLGARFDYKLNPDFNLGGTVLHLAEKPFVYRVGIGDEPTNNTIYGLDLNYRRESRFLTKMIDKLPIIQTKVPSVVTINSEFAQLLPAKSKLRGEDGVSFIDDFESVKTPYTLGGFGTSGWRLATTPVTPDDRFGALQPDRAYAYSRAKIAWYSIDQVYYTGSSQKPSNIATGDVKNHYVRAVQKRELFPNRDPEIANNNEYTFDVAYYPGERGQYNYSPDVADDGKHFKQGFNLKRNYGGISREITFDTDFDNANIEYMEFWMMDPFLPGPNGVVNDSENPATNNTTGGRLVFNLGNVSEDLMKNANRYEFENGLPTGDNPEEDTERTPWGRVSTLQFLTDAFDNDAGSRSRQDIGLDGLNDSDEKQFFSGIYSNLDDPSNDNFKHHLNAEYTNRDVKILGRYKNYNGMEGNSPENSIETSYTFPDKEDLNKDNIVSDVERYYEYSIPLEPGQLAVGTNPYIVDKVENEINGETVTWYQFRIPVRSPLARNIGGISGYKSIRFLRMYLTDFEQPAVLRFVQFQFVANQWRKFQTAIIENNEPCTGICDPSADKFDVSAVNIEENGEVSSGAIPYVLPPGTVRQDDYASQNKRRLNEQSMQICVENLVDKYGKAVYKNVSMDMLIYKRLKMFIHAESPNNVTRDGQMRAFIRIGTDYTQNYYEYSVPLKMTQQGTSDPYAIWPKENEIDVAFQDFVDAKARRNMTTDNRRTPFTITREDGKSITVVGNPDFSAVQGIMIGVLNPRDDGAEQSVCIWVNEMRVSDFDKTAGWAATARVNAKLADVADITATGRYTTVGFGGIQQKIAQRARENTRQFDLNSNIVADKFLPSALGLKVPLSVQYGVIESEPRYDPLEGDMELSQSLEKYANSPEDKAAYKKEVLDRTTTKSISLLNVRKEKTNPNSKPKVYDIENISLSYAYSEKLHTDILTDRDLTKIYTGGLAYTYNATPKNYAPFEQSTKFQSPYLRPIKELNATFLPSRLAFRADLDRRYNELQFQRRNNPYELPSTTGILPLYQKTFFFNRIYDLKWEFTKALSFDYTATNRAIVDEPYGPLTKENNKVAFENLKNFGRNTNFDQTAALNYRLPLDKFPLTDWVSADTRYQVSYTWTASSNFLNSVSDTASSQLKLGNTIQNNAETSVNGRIDLVKLYNKVKFLNKINNEQPKQAEVKRPAAKAPVKPGTVAAKPTEAKKDTTKGPELKALKTILRGLMTARTLNVTYVRSEGSLLPGYLPGTKFFGFEEGFGAPGLGFVAGKQYGLDELYDRADRNGWYTDSSQYLQTPLSSLKTWSLNMRTELQPIRNFNILVDAKKDVSDIREVFYRRPVNDTTGVVIPDRRAEAQNPINTGAFSVSTITIQTMFEARPDNYVSKAFEQFIINRQQILTKLLSDPLTNPSGSLQDSVYKLNSQDVLIPAFHLAYQGKDASGYKTERAKASDLTKRIPLPNWRIDYSGLSNLEFVKRYLSSISISHGYQSTYGVTNFASSLSYLTPNLGFPSIENERGEYIPYYVVSQVTIMERLTPLLGVNFKTKNNITGRIEYKTERNLSLNLSNAQVTENHVKDIVIGAGYSTSNFRIPFKINGEYKTLKNELTGRLDLSIRDNTIIQRSIVQDSVSGAIVEKSRNEVTNGNMQLQLRPTIDYTVNQRLNVQLYFTRTISDPKISTSFKNTVTEGGVQLRYSLSQ